MNKRNLFLIAFIVLLLFSGLYIFFQNDTTTNKNATNKSLTPTQQIDKPTVSTSLNSEESMPGTYDEYSETSLANASGQRILFFYASWCYQCRQLDADLKEKTIPEGYNFYKVDYDSRQDLRQKYGVTFRTAFVKIDESGSKIGEEYIAYNEPSLDAVVRDFLRN